MSIVMRAMSNVQRVTHEVHPKPGGGRMSDREIHAEGFCMMEHFGVYPSTKTRGFSRGIESGCYVAENGAGVSYRRPSGAPTWWLEGLAKVGGTTVDALRTRRPFSTFIRAIDVVDHGTPVVIAGATCAKLLAAIEKMEGESLTAKVTAVMTGDDATHWLAAHDILKTLFRTAGDGGFLGIN